MLSINSPIKQAHDESNGIILYNRYLFTRRAHPPGHKIFTPSEGTKTTATPLPSTYHRAGRVCLFRFICYVSYAMGFVRHREMMMHVFHMFCFIFLFFLKVCCFGRGEPFPYAMHASMTGTQNVNATSPLFHIYETFPSFI